MRVKLPKPLHGWREFVGEVGIIVLGVLIALRAQQVVETMQTHQRIRETRAALDAELSRNLAAFAGSMPGWMKRAGNRRFFRVLKRKKAALFLLYRLLSPRTTVRAPLSSPLSEVSKLGRSAIFAAPAFFLRDPWLPRGRSRLWSRLAGGAP